MSQNYAQMFNSSQIGVDLSNKMQNIKPDTTVNPAEIQAKIYKDNVKINQGGDSFEKQTGPINEQNNPKTPDVQAQTQTQTLAVNPEYTSYKPNIPNYQNYQMTASYPLCAQYSYPMSYNQPQSVQTQAAMPQALPLTNQTVNNYQAQPNVQNAQTQSGFGQ